MSVARDIESPIIPLHVDSYIQHMCTVLSINFLNSPSFHNPSGDKDDKLQWPMILDVVVDGISKNWLASLIVRLDPFVGCNCSGSSDLGAICFLNIGFRNKGQDSTEQGPAIIQHLFHRSSFNSWRYGKNPLNVSPWQLSSDSKVVFR